MAKSKDHLDWIEKKKDQRARDGAKATAEYEAAARAVRENTARLRALRLAKEAAKSEAATNKNKAKK